MNLLATLRGEVPEWRAHPVLMPAGNIPASIPFLRGALSAISDPQERDSLLVAIANEYFRAGLDDKVLQVGRERTLANPEAIVVWTSLGVLLSEHPGNEIEAGKACAKGLEMARARNALVRHALICQALVAKNTNDATLFDSSLSDLIDDAKNSRQEDCGLNFEITNNLPNNFGSPPLISKYREIAHT